jgi:hypothetical protein
MHVGAISLEKTGLAARFAEMAHSDEPLTTLDSGEGSCAVWRWGDGGFASRSKLVSAGLLTVTGAARPFTVFPDTGDVAVRDANVYYDYGSREGIFFPGQAVSISASGDAVPAFSIPDLVLAEPVSFSQPVLRDDWTSVDESSQSIPIDRAVGFQVKWTGWRFG